MSMNSAELSMGTLPKSEESINTWEPSGSASYWKVVRNSSIYMMDYDS
jgi:hypothetical protein